MATIQKITGVLDTTGPVNYSGPDRRAESAAVYDYLRIEGDDGREHFLEKVAVPSYLDASIAVGMKGTFYFVTITFPTLLGSQPVRYLFATSSGGKLRQAIPQAARCATQGNIGVALRLFWYGIILMPAFGVGLLYWLAALRFIRIKAPVNDMQQIVDTSA